MTNVLDGNIYRKFAEIDKNIQTMLLNIRKLVLEKFQTMLLIQVPAPKLFIIFSISEIPIYGSNSMLSCWANYRIIMWAKEGSNRHPSFFCINNGSMPYTFVLAITQRLQPFIQLA